MAYSRFICTPVIKKFIQKLLSKNSVTAVPNGKEPQPTLIHAKTHQINRQLISKNAIQVTETLQKAGFQAFIVGGAIRDLLLNISPKDFDVATNATPFQIQRLFSRARIIGRRFQIVHVLFGREIIEVSTFRSAINEGRQLEQISQHHAIDQSGRLLRDNVWGTQYQDANRRDFTINAIYYDPKTQCIYDFHHSLTDIQNKTLRMIGDPETRYREDPVRILRAIRLSAKLNFTLAPHTQAPIAQQKSLLHNIPSSRLFDEILKMLMSGHAVASLNGLHQENLMHHLLPLLAFTSQQTQYEKFIQLALADTDQRIHSGKKASPGFLFTILLWPDINQHHQALIKQGVYPFPALHEAISQVFNQQKLAIHRRYLSDIREIGVLQLRLEKPSRNAAKLINAPRFRAAYDFLLLRVASEQVDAKITQWWNDFLNADSAQRQQLIADYLQTQPKRRKRAKQKQT